MIPFDPHPEGLIVGVRASPGARKNGITGEHAGQLKVSVTQAPEKGKANQAILETLAEALGLKKSQLELLAGKTSGAKRFLIRGLSAEELAARLAPFLNPS